MRYPSTNHLLRFAGSLMLAMLLLATPLPAQDEDEVVAAYDKAQLALSKNEYQRAVELFQQAYLTNTQSHLAADALYWQAWSLYRLGEMKYLRQATEILDLQQKKYHSARTHDDSAALQARIYGKLAEMGDARAARWITEQAEEQPNEDLELKLATLQALMNMKSERALPILRKVLANREPGTAELREMALHLLSQHDDPESVDLLLDVARNDPEPGVRQQAVFWLSQVRSEKALELLEEIARESEDKEMQEQALFGLSEHGGARAIQTLKEIASRDDLPAETRQQAIFWLARSSGAEQTAFLIDLYGRTSDRETKEQILFSVTQCEDEQAYDWLLQVAFDDREDPEIRSMALHWACQHRDCPVAELEKYYEQAVDVEMREQIIFVLSHSDDPAALDLLMRVAREEKDLELRKSAIFWIGQFDDPRVEEFLLGIIEE